MRTAYDAVMDWLTGVAMELGDIAVGLAKFVGMVIFAFAIAWGLVLAFGAATWILKALGF